MEALSRSHSGDWAQLKTGHVQRPSQHLLNAELSRLAGSRAPSEQQSQLQMTQNSNNNNNSHHHPYDSLGNTTTQSNKSDHDSGPKLEDFLGGASSLGGQYTTTGTNSSNRTSENSNFENLYMRDINVNLSPYSASNGAGATGATTQASHVPPSFHAYGLQQRTDNNSSSQQSPYDSHSRHNVHSSAGGGVSTDPTALCHPNVHAQNLLQVAFVDHQHHHLHHGGGGSSSSTATPTAASDSMLQDCTLQLPSHQGPNLSALKTWLRHSQAASNSLVTASAMNVGSGCSPGINASSGGGGGGVGDNKPGIGKLNASSIPSMASLHHQSLSLSMSPGSQSSNSLAATGAQSGANGASITSDGSPETRKRGAGARAGSKEASPRKSIDTFGQRTSVFRGVTRHRWTGRYEAHLWDNSCRKEGQTRKGRQVANSGSSVLGNLARMVVRHPFSFIGSAVYLGGYDKEEKAARAYDLAALKYWGPNTTINFPLQQYEKELEEMKNMTRQEYVASLRRKSSGFSRGASVYRGVTRHHQHGRWQARIGRVAGNKDLYLGTYSTQEEAAEAYDIAAIKFRGINAVTNFDISRYDTKRICGTAHNAVDDESPKLLGSTSSSKELAVLGILDQPSDPSVDGHQTDDDSQSLQTGNTNSTSQLTDGMVSKSQLQDWQMLYNPHHHGNHHGNHHHQQQQRSWDDPNPHHQQDIRTQTLISDSLGHKFLQSPVAGNNMHSAVLRNLMGLSDSGGASGSESSGGMLAGLHGSSNSPLLGGNSGFPSPKSLREQQQQQQHSEDEGSKSAGGGQGGQASPYDNVLQGDLSRHILFMPHSQSPPPSHSSGGTKSSSSYDNSSLGNVNHSWMTTTPQANLNQRVSSAGHLGVGHIPIFAVWND
ncbi:hypothetical protein R1sor_016586 [Riccia sorocarpa]|uniref:AP2/ERF domain-containing protein n=1 Tax=Riccia sorocarpa TaxID=122646 RepID=A0ABD3HI78_9MARC